MKVLPPLLIATVTILLSKTAPALGIPITPAKDSTGTQVTSEANNSLQLNIDGGTRSGSNLFHSFEKFGLSKDQIANFQSNPNIRNILGRVVGGDASRINGLIQVVGGRSNLFLMNPAGFIFGPDATLKIPGSFTATTANGIQVDEYWFDAMGTNEYSNLVGEPSGFAFIGDQAGNIINAGNLTVPKGEQITLAGGIVINTGTLSAPGGNVTIVSVPDKQLVRMSQEGSLISLELPASVESSFSPDSNKFSPLSLPELLTGGSEQIATGVIADSSGVYLTSSDTELPSDAGSTILSGIVDVSDIDGGTTHILGDIVSLYTSGINGNLKIEASKNIIVNAPVTIESLNLLVEQGDIKIFSSITTPKLIITNNDGDIIIGTGGKDPSSSISSEINIDIKNLEIEEIEDPDLAPSFNGVREEITPLGGTANISARNGFVRLMGGITLDGKSQLKIDALGFRATNPLVTTATANSGPNGSVEETTIKYNIGVFYTDSPIQFSVQFLNPEAEKQNKKTALISEGSNKFIPFNENRRPNIEIVLREDISLPIGSDNILTTGSGIEEPIGSFVISNTGNGSAASQLSSFSTDEFSVGLIDPAPSPTSNPTSPTSNPTSPTSNPTSPTSNPTSPTSNPSSQEDSSQISRTNTENSFNLNRYKARKNLDLYSADSQTDFTFLPLEGTNLVQVSRNDLLFLLVESPLDKQGNPLSITPELLPKLLTGNEEEQ